MQNSLMEPTSATTTTDIQLHTEKRTFHKHLKQSDTNAELVHGANIGYRVMHGGASHDKLKQRDTSAELVYGTAEAAVTLHDELPSFFHDHQVKPGRRMHGMHSCRIPYRISTHNPLPVHTSTPQYLTPNGRYP